MELVPIHIAAKELGVRPETLRRWEALGWIEPPVRTSGGQRRYDLAKLRAVAPRKAPPKRMTLAYARVSSRDQQENLKHQADLLEAFCAQNGWRFELIQDIGSGLNYNKNGLQTLLDRICSGQAERLVLTHKDRLLRFGSELIFSLCERFGTEVVLINESPQESSFEQELAQDVLEIITVFSAKLYGSRSPKNQRMAKALRAATQEAKRS